MAFISKCTNTDVAKRRPTARRNCGLDFLSQDPINTSMDFFILIVRRMGSEGGGGAFRLVNSTRPQTGFDSVCVALKVTRKKEGQIKAGVGGREAEEGTTGTRERDGPAEGYYKRRENQANTRNSLGERKKSPTLGL